MVHGGVLRRGGELGEVSAELGEVEASRVSSVCVEPVGAERGIGFVAVAREEFPGHPFFCAPSDAGERVGVVGEDGDGVTSPGAGGEIVAGIR